MKHALMAQHQADYEVRLMARVLAVSPAGFYAATSRQTHPSPRTAANRQLLHAIHVAHAASHQRYGAPRVHAELQAQGTRCGHNRVARLMRTAGLRGGAPRRFRVTTDSDHRQPVAANVLARRFTPAAYERNQAWVADVTHLPTREGWLYLAVLLDLASRRVVGWCADRTLEQSLTLRALDQAFTLRQPRPGLLHHSDRGVQYANTAYQQRLRAQGVVASMSRVGNCWDNAVAESFFATLKRELLARLPHKRWETRPAALTDLQHFINRWYNHQRRHSALGYRSPIDYERQLTGLRFA